MIQKIVGYIKSEWRELAISLIVVVFEVGFLKSIPQYPYSGIINTTILLLSLLWLKNKSHILGTLIFINVICISNILTSSKVAYCKYLLIIRAIVFIIFLVWGLRAVWIAKKSKLKKFNCYLLLSLIAVVISLGGLYHSLYELCFPDGLEALKIEQEMSYSQALMPEDFIFYSADAFFGTSISDVKIKYIDEAKLYDDQGAQVNNMSMLKYAKIIIQFVKVISLLESILFLIYISIIVMNVEDNDKTNTNVK